jgi:hypothetical protein
LVKTSGLEVVRKFRGKSFEQWDQLRKSIKALRELLIYRGLVMLGKFGWALTLDLATTVSLLDVLKGVPAGRGQLCQCKEQIQSREWLAKRWLTGWLGGGLAVVL